MGDDETCTDCPDDEATLSTTGPDPRGGKITMWGPALLAPIGTPTGDKRRFAAHSLTHRELPLPLTWQRERGQGHEGAVTIGTLHGIRYDENGAPHGFGILFDPDPEQLPRLAQDVAEARMLLDQKVTGPSVDLDSMQFHALDPEEAGEYAADARPEIEVDKGRISAATLVPIPAFAEARPFPLSELDPADWDKVVSDYAAEVGALTASVRTEGWDRLPMAPADTEWSASEAVARLKDRGDAELRRACLWSDGTDARFPLADVDPVTGGLVLVPAAIEAAYAVLEAGASILPETDQAAMRTVLDGLRDDPDLAALAVAVRAMPEDEFGELAEAVEDAGEETFGARFDALVAKLKGKVGDPAAVAAKVGRMKYGKKGMARLRAGVAASKVKPLHGAMTAAGYLDVLIAAAETGDWRGIEEYDMDALVASAAGDALPRAWFDDPKLTGPTPLTVMDDGRVFGHLATWKNCHIGFPGQCVTAPKSRAQYAYFHTGEVVTDGGPVSVGRVTIGTGHANTRYGFQAAVEHYDHTGHQAAVVRAGEDKFGIWVAGAALPGTDVAELRRSPLSGDWRRIGGNLELVGALAVNTPGFPIPRAMTASGEPLALVAAGAVPQGGVTYVESTVDIPALVAATVAETRRQDAAAARRTAALGALASIDDELAASQEADRKLRAARAAMALRG